MNTDQKPKTSLVFLIIALIILALTGGYFFYGQGLLKKAKTGDNAQIGETDKKDEAVNDGAQVTNNKWITYNNDVCGYSVNIPNDWEKIDAEFTRDIIFKRNRQNNPYPFTFRISCFSSIESLDQGRTENNFTFKDYAKIFPGFDSQIKNLEDYLTRKHPKNPNNTLSGAINVKKIKVNDNYAYISEFGGNYNVCEVYIDANTNTKIYRLTFEEINNCEKFLNEEETVLNSFNIF